MAAPHVKADESATYGYGLMRRTDIPGENVTFHSGGIPGFSSMNVYLPKKKLSMIVLSNDFDGPMTSLFAWDLLTIVLGGSVETPTAERHPSP